MSDFKTATPDDLALDPKKRVRYSNGLVLGVDEFQQQELYFREKGRLHNRALHGSGTFCGLAIEIRQTVDGPEVVVQPGLALNPRGEVICVCEAQCARLGEWLARHRDELDGGSPPTDLTLYVVLCYRECETDRVPVPGGPCRSLDDSSAPSRITEAFELSLRLEPPRQEEEEGVRRFGELLRSIELTEGGDGVLTVEELEALVRALPTPDWELPPDLRLPAGEAEQAIDSALRVWVTEVRPSLLSEAESFACGLPEEECVLLGAIEFSVETVGEELRVQGEVDIDGAGRPYLLHTRLLQELVGGVLQRQGAIGEVQLALDDLTDVDAANPPAAGFLRWNEGAGRWQVAEIPSLLTLEEVATELPTLPFVTITREPSEGEGPVFRLWFHVNAGPSLARTNLPELQPDFTFRVFGETHERGPGPALFQQRFRILEFEPVSPPQRNVFRLRLEPAANGSRYLRFRFDLLPMRLVEGQRNFSLLEWTRERPIKWVGHEGNQFLTTFFENLPSDPARESGLVRIVALSWRHGQTARFGLNLDGETVFGLMVGFGFEKVDDGGRVQVRPGSLDSQSFQVWLEEEGGRAANRVRLTPLDLVPVEPILGDNGVIVGGRRAASPLASGAALLFDPSVIDQTAGSPRVLVHLRGNFVQDDSEPEPRAIDAEFLRGRLPTGRPGGGIQGGTFESWIPIRRRVPLGDLDLNRADEEDLRRLPGIGQAMARRILARRRELGGFERLEDLLEVQGINETVLERLRRGRPA